MATAKQLVDFVSESLTTEERATVDHQRVARGKNDPPLSADAPLRFNEVGMLLRLRMNASIADLAWVMRVPPKELEAMERGDLPVEPMRAFWCASPPLPPKAPPRGPFVAKLRRRKRRPRPPA